MQSSNIPNENKTYTLIRRSAWRGCQSVKGLSHQDYKDIVQDVFLIYLQMEVEYFNSIIDFGALSYQISRNAALRESRKRGARKQVSLNDADLEIDPSIEAEPETDPELLKNVVLVSKLFMINLNDNQRDIFRMHFFEGLKYKDISEKTGCTQDSVKSIVCVLKKKLRRFSYKFLTPYFYRD